MPKEPEIRKWKKLPRPPAFQAVNNIRKYNKTLELMKISEKIKDAFANIDRKEFLTGKYKYAAKIDVALPSYSNQTTSQPSLIAHIFDAVQLKEGDYLGEIGYGSVFLLRVGHEVTKRPVHGVEIGQTLANFGKKNLRRTSSSKKYFQDNYKLKWIKPGEERHAHPEQKFDALIVSAGLERQKEEHITELITKNQKIQSFLSMLNTGGRLAIPIGVKYELEKSKIKYIKGPIYVFEKKGGKISWRIASPLTQFVKLI